MWEWDNTGIYIIISLYFLEQFFIYQVCKQSPKSKVVLLCELDRKVLQTIDTHASTIISVFLLLEIKGYLFYLLSINLCMEIILSVFYVIFLRKIPTYKREQFFQFWFTDTRIKYEFRFKIVSVLKFDNSTFA